MFASKFVRAIKNEAGEAETTAEFLGAQSLCLCIAGFLHKSGVAQNALLQQSTRDFN
jgi:hypothetical protein